jgi:hypothetical protein
VSSAQEGDNENVNTSKLATTGRFIARDDGSSRHETTPFQLNLDRTVHAVGTGSNQIYCGVCRGYIDQGWHPRCHTTVEQRTPVTVEISDDSDEEEKSSTAVEVVTVRNNSMTPVPHINSDDSDRR